MKPPVTATALAEPFGRYRLLELIAEGGMAEVFKAKSFGVEGFEKVLVIKRIHRSLAKHRAFVDLFVQEAKLTVRLAHANIVQVFDLGRVPAPDGGPARYYIAMEYVAGVDLATVVRWFRRERRVLPIGFAVYVACEVAKALDHAHRRTGDDGAPLGIVHRDISPQNILLSWEGEVKVTDFGIAKAVDAIDPAARRDDTEAARATGKLSFMSPEQSRSGQTDARSDLFSLGTVLYQLIAGENPFAAPTANETVRRIQAGEYPPAALSRPEIPDTLSGLLARLLAVDPAARLESAAAVHEALMGFAYTAGARYTAADVATLLAPLRDTAEDDAATPTARADGGDAAPAGPGDETGAVAPGPKDDLDVPGAEVLLAPSSEEDRTPVEVPQVPSPIEREPRGAERREVTLLVASLDPGHRDGDPAEGASSSSSALPPRLQRLQDLIERHGGWIEERQGNQLTSIFGLGETNGRDADAAVRAALVLVRERSAGGQRPVSCGIHSGPMSVDDGGIPVPDERLTTLIATAQRLARVAEGQVLVSNVSGRLVRRHFVLEPLPASSRAVADGGSIVRRPDLDASHPTRFVGRSQPLKRLGQVLARGTRREPQLVVIRGETGLGKTRLLHEAKRRLARGDFNVGFYQASCPLNGASQPWSGLRTMLHVLCGTQEDDDPERIVEVRPRLRALGLDGSATTRVLQLLGAPVRGHAEETRVTLRASFERMVSSLSKDRIHCFAWDDAQALDRESLDTIIRILRSHGPHRRGLRAVFLLSLRGEVPPALARRSGLHLIDLDALSHRETEKLLRHHLQARMVPDALLAYVRNHAGGHPLFIEELVRELVDRGIVRTLNGRVEMSGAPTTVAPRTLRTLVADRVSRLPQRERRVLQGLAVLGEPAFSPMVATILEQSLPQLDRHLTRLEERGLLRRAGPTQIRFASPLFEEIVLSAMPVAHRQALHESAADAYRRAQLPGPGETDEKVAEHLVGAGRPEASVAHFWRAAEAKLSAEQYEPALRCMMLTFERLDPSTVPPEELTGWLGATAAVVSQLRHAPGMKEAIAPILRSVASRGDEASNALAHIHAARVLGAVNLFDDAYEALAVANPDQLEDRRLIRDSLAAEAQLAARQGHFLRAVAAGDKLEALGLTDDVDVLATLALARAMSGDPEGGLELMERAEATGPPVDTAESVVRMKHWVLIHFNRRDYEAAAEVCTRLAALARETGLRFDCAAALHNLADVYRRSGQNPRAYAAYMESLELTEQLEHERLTNLNQMHLCYLDGLRGDETADERFRRHVRFADAHGYLWDVLEGRLLLGRLAAVNGNTEQARALLEDVKARAEEQGHSFIRRDAEEVLETLTARDQDTAAPNGGDDGRRDDDDGVPPVVP